LTVVLDVVMDQREVVQQFNGSSGGKGLLPLSTSGLTAHQQQGRADALAGLPLIGLIVGVHPSHRVAEHGGQLRCDFSGFENLIKKAAKGCLKFLQIDWNKVL